jgi:TonB family protein
VAGTSSLRGIPHLALITLLILIRTLAAAGVYAQSTPPDTQPNPTKQPTPAGSQPSPATTQPSSPPSASSADGNQPNSTVAQPAPVNPAPAGPSAEEQKKRIERARALAAAHQLAAAARELEYVRGTSGGDVALRDGTSVMLMGIYLEDGNYARAQSLLEETFQARTAGKDGSIRSYYALAGQAINGLRLHLARYRSFGVSLGSASLPPEATNDLERLRLMLERMVAQAKEIAKNAPSANDSLALLEDVLGLRTSLARDNEDRDRWQMEYAQAREQLGLARMEIASIAGAPSLGRPVQTQSTQQPFENSAKQTSSSQAASTSNTPQPMFAGSLNSRASKRVVPTYPQIAKASGAEGAVKVHVIVNESGNVQVTKSEGPMLLRQAAEDAARGWKFPPTMAEGKAIRITGFIEFNFTSK